MADTIRTEAELLNDLFQDAQVAGSITAQDVRDLVVSIKSIAANETSAFAQLSSSTTIALTTPNVPEPIPFDTHDEEVNITHYQGSPAIATIELGGVYSVIGGFQLLQSGGGASTITVWIEEDTGSGFAVEENTAVRQNLGNAETRVLMINHTGSQAAGDRIRFMWNTTNLNAELTAFSAGGSPQGSPIWPVPEVPSAIATITRMGIE